MKIASDVGLTVSANVRKQAARRGNGDLWLRRPIQVAVSAMLLASVLPAPAMAAGALILNDGKAHAVSGTAYDAGTSSYAISVTGLNTSLVADGVTASSATNKGAGVSVAANATLSISDSVVTATGYNGSGIMTSGTKNTSATVKVRGGSVTTTGDADRLRSGDRPYGMAVLASGVYANTSASLNSIELDGTTVETSGKNAGGLVAYVGVIDGSNVTVKTSGDDAYGAQTIAGGNVVGTIGLDDSSITTSGARSHGLLSDGRNRTSTLPDSLISLSGGSVTTHGDDAFGASALDTGHVTLQETHVQTTGARASGVSAISGGTIDTTGGSIATSGQGAAAMGASDAGTVLTTHATTLATSGDQSLGVSVQQGASAVVSGGSIATTGAQSAGVMAASGATLALSDTTVNTSGSASHGAVLSGSGGLTMTNTTLMATGESAHGLFADAQHASGARDSVSLTGGSIQSAQGSAVRVDGASLDVHADGDAQLSGITLLEVTTDAAGSHAAVSLSATDNVTLSGDIAADAQSSVDVALNRAATWTGAARNVGALSVSDGAVWNVNGDSNVASASMAGGSVDFVRSSDGTFKTLNVAGGWNASASNGRNPSVTLNTTLNEGGALSNQKTDRLLIAGDASGSTTLNVRAQGAGAVTSTSATPGANEGISLVQVGGNASAKSFELQNGYVAVGPLQYRLSATAPGASSAAQRLVAGSGDAYWDYRLNAVQVSEGGSFVNNGSGTTGNVTLSDGRHSMASPEGSDVVGSAGTTGTTTGGTTGTPGTNGGTTGGTTGATSGGTTIATTNPTTDGTNGDTTTAEARPDDTGAPANNSNLQPADATLNATKGVAKPDTRSLLVPQAPSYFAAKTALTQHLVDGLPTLHARTGAMPMDADDGAGSGRGAYARTYGNNYTQHTDRSFMQYGSDFDVQSGGAQAGADVYTRRFGNGASVQLGVFGAYGAGRTSSNAVDGASRSSFDSIGGGVSATYRFSNGAYVDGVAKIDRLSDSFSTNGRDVASTKGMGYTFAAETGYARALPKSWFVDGRLTLGVVNVNLNDTVDADGIDVQFGSQTSALGRVDARVGRDFGAGDKRVRPYVRAGLEGVAGGDTAVSLSGYRFNGSNVGNTWIAGTGVDARFGKSTTLAIDGGYRGRLGAAGAQGVEGNVTFKRTF